VNQKQYVLGYHSTNEAKDGKWRKIRLIGQPTKRTPQSVSPRKKRVQRGDVIPSRKKLLRNSSNAHQRNKPRASIPSRITFFF